MTVPIKTRGMVNLRLAYFLAQRRDLFEARKREQAKRKPQRDRRGADTGGRDEQIPQRGVARRSMSLENAHNHRKGQNQHGDHGHAFEDDQHKAGAPCGDDAERSDNQGRDPGQDKTGRRLPQGKPLQQIGSEEADGTETDDGKAEIGPKQRPSRDQARARAEDCAHEPIGGAGVGMVAGQSRKTPRHQQHDERGECEDERNHATDMFGGLLGIEIHGHRGRHPGDGDRDGIPGADALEQDGGGIDGGATRHDGKLARGPGSGRDGRPASFTKRRAADGPVNAR